MGCRRKETNSSHRVQILDESIYISHRAWKGMNPKILSLAYRARLISLTTSLGEGKI